MRRGVRIFLLVTGQLFESDELSRIWRPAFWWGGRSQAPDRCGLGAHRGCQLTRFGGAEHAAVPKRKVTVTESADAVTFVVLAEPTWTVTEAVFTVTEHVTTFTKYTVDFTHTIHTNVM